MEEALVDLPEKDMEMELLILLRPTPGHTVQEIAATLGVSQKTVKGLVKLLNQRGIEIKIGNHGSDALLDSARVIVARWCWTKVQALGQEYWDRVYEGVPA